MRLTCLIGCALLLATVARAQEVTPCDYLAVFDSAGSRVGMVMDHPGNTNYASVRVYLDGRGFNFNIEANSFSPGNGRLFFKTHDCSGIPYLDYSWVPALAALDTNWRTEFYALGPPDTTVFVPDRSAAVVEETVYSSHEWFRDTDGSYNYRCYQATGSALMIKAAPLVKLNSIWTPPFHIECLTFEPCFCPRRRISASPSSASTQNDE